MIYAYDVVIVGYEKDTGLNRYGICVLTVDEDDIIVRLNDINTIDCTKAKLINIKSYDTKRAFKTCYNARVVCGDFMKDYLTKGEKYEDIDCTIRANNATWKVGEIIYPDQLSSPAKLTLYKSEELAYRDIESIYRDRAELYHQAGKTYKYYKLLETKSNKQLFIPSTRDVE